ncbi:hypothetical protein SAMN03159341_103146 [Paenibacillus sp. 1_12]|uniref:hypothetical protein n=1 Tax=Paenibacillus sp. 1_12 TaxID=1566278 RepID=UPI0008E1410B|nr:hypothetical protein [Paenibacillus sp. 1_12]SFL08820.1 hypothetical protein SAMN03159341_103146 [Paenibacillus sp. 1_12]
MKQAIFIGAIAAYLISIVYPSDILKWTISIVSLCIVVMVFSTVKRFVQGLGILFLVTGFSMLIVHKAHWSSYILGFGNMLNILSLFALIPLIALPIQLGQYAVRVQHKIQSKIKHSGMLYAITSLMSYILSSFMNLATLPMVYQTIRPALDLYPIEKKERFISRAITHGYSMPIVWTPVAPIVGVIVEMTGVRWSSILLIMIPFSLLGLVLDWFMGQWIANRRARLIGQVAIEETSAVRESAVESGLQQLEQNKKNHPIHIIVAIIVFNGLLLVLETYTSFSFLLLVSLIVIPFAFLWSWLIGKGRAFIVEGKVMLSGHLLKMREQFFVFLSAGFLIASIQATGAGHEINLWIIAIKDFIGADIFLLCIPLIPLGLAFIGLHPAVGLALTAESLNPQSLGISVELTAIAMLTGAATAFLMGPYNATAGLMSSLTKESSYKISNWNLPFTTAYILLSMTLLLVLKNMG